MSSKKKLITGIFAILVLTLVSVMAVYAETDSSSIEAQPQETAGGTSPTITAGAAAAEKEVAKAQQAKAAQETADNQNPPAKATVIEAGQKLFAATNAKAAPDSAPETEPAAAAASDYQLRSLGIFRTTGYCSCRHCSSNWGTLTSSGAVTRSNHTIAVDPRVIPYGSQVMINGIIYTAEDCGSGVRGNHIDIYYDTHAQARRHGLQHAEVFLVY